MDRTRTALFHLERGGAAGRRGRNESAGERSTRGGPGVGPWGSADRLHDYQNAPAWVWFLGEDGVAEELPKTASGKVQKHILRAWSTELAKKGVGRVSSPSEGSR